MTELPFVDVVGFWVATFLTFCCLSFLYKDNPFYKLAEHLFIGVSVGYLIILQWGDNLQPKLVDALFVRGYRALAEGGSLDRWWVMRGIALVLVVMLFVNALSRRYKWVGRYPVAFVVAFYAGLQINAVAQSELGEQIKFSASTIDAPKVDLNSAPLDQLTSLPGGSPSIAEKLIVERARAPFTSVDDAVTRPSLTAPERADLAETRGHLVGLDARAAVGPGEHDRFGIVSNLLLLLGLLSSLVYFYFSVAHQGVIGKVSRFGVWTLMIGFGASFGLTVQGRISLAIGRAYDVSGRTVGPTDAARIHSLPVAVVCLLLVVGGIVVWELRNRRRSGKDSA